MREGVNDNSVLPTVRTKRGMKDVDRRRHKNNAITVINKRRQNVDGANNPQYAAEDDNKICNRWFCTL